MIFSSYQMIDRPTFTDIFNTVGEFQQFILTDCQIPFFEAGTDKLTLSSLIYYLLYAEYGNSTIASYDTNQFKYQVASVIATYGPVWRAKLNLSADIENLSDADLKDAGRMFTNSGMNPSASPLTDTTTGIKSDTRTVNISERGKADRLAIKYSMLPTEANATFISKFKQLFSKIIVGRPHLYPEV